MYVLGKKKKTEKGQYYTAQKPNAPSLGRIGSWGLDCFCGFMVTVYLRTLFFVLFC